MKRTILLLSVLFFYGIINAQCPQGNITLTTQQKVDNFAINYPGCTEILEDFTIAGDDITNLNGLNQITSVSGNLYIHSNPLLQSLDGLDNLSQVGRLYIGYYAFWWVYDPYPTFYDEFLPNPVLTDLTALQSLDSVNSTVSIQANYSLTSLAGLENISPAHSNWTITDNYNLSECNLDNICLHFIEGGSTWKWVENNASGCNTATEIIESCTLLPIEMSTPLQVRLQNRVAILTWRTETETNNSGFEIQRSKDGINWEKIGWQAGQGTTIAPHPYTHRDANPLSGISYYRLKQVDFDGQFDYSNIVSLRYDKPEGITVYPIPAKDVVIFEVPNIAAADDIILYDITGREISRQAFPQDKQLAVSHLNDGVYIYRIFYEDEVYSGKIVVE